MKIGILIIGLLFICFTWISCNSNQLKRQDMKDSIPKQDLPFKYELSAKVYPTTIESLSGTLTNNTPFPALYGAAYRIEYYNEDAWEEVQIETNDSIVIIFPSIGYQLSPAGWKDFSAHMWQQYHTYKAGRYRISKDLSVELHTDLYVLDVKELKDSCMINGIDSEYFSIAILPDKITVETDTIILKVTNHSETEITNEQINLTRFTKDKQTQSIHLPPQDTSSIQPGKSKEYIIALNSDQIQMSPGLYKGKYKLYPGEYHLHPYFTVKLVEEFELSDSKRILKDYDENKAMYTYRQSPEFPGGKKELEKFVEQQFQVPEKYQYTSIPLSVLYGFKVDALGYISDIKIKSASKDSLFDREALRVIKKMPRWLPVFTSRGATISSATISFVYENGKIGIE